MVRWLCVMVAIVVASLIVTDNAKADRFRSRSVQINSVRGGGFFPRANVSSVRVRSFGNAGFVHPQANFGVRFDQFGRVFVPNSHVRVRSFNNFNSFGHSGFVPSGFGVQSFNSFGGFVPFSGGCQQNFQSFGGGCSQSFQSFGAFGGCH